MPLRVYPRNVPSKNCGTLATPSNDERIKDQSTWEEKERGDLKTYETENTICGGKAFGSRTAADNLLIVIGGLVKLFPRIGRFEYQFEFGHLARNIFESYRGKAGISFG